MGPYIPPNRNLTEKNCWFKLCIKFTTTIKYLLYLYIFNLNYYRLLMLYIWLIALTLFNCFNLQNNIILHLFTWIKHMISMNHGNFQVGFLCCKLLTKSLCWASFKRLTRVSASALGCELLIAIGTISFEHVSYKMQSLLESMMFGTIE